MVLLQSQLFQRRAGSTVEELNPNAVILAEVRFMSIDSGYRIIRWLRVNGERQQFWQYAPDGLGNPEFRRHVVRQTAALMESGIDGVFYDNLRKSQNLDRLHAGSTAGGGR